MIKMLNNSVFKLFILFLIVSGCTRTNKFTTTENQYKKSIRSLDIEVISPSAGSPKETWNAITQLTGKTFRTNEGTSTDQVYSNTFEKFKLLDKSLKSDHKILWAIRGGYGLDKIMTYIASTDYSNVEKKIIVGYSDITSILYYFSQKYGWKTISACVFKELIERNKSEETYDKILNYLTGKTSCFLLNDLEALNEEAQNSSKIHGKTTGGNMSIIQASIGTKWQIDTKGKILFLEDVNVSGYLLDRILEHFKNSGIFKDVRAIIFGDFCSNETHVLENFSKSIKIPVFISNKFGHGKTNCPIGYNFNGEIGKNSIGENFRLTMQ